jgi:Tol biopolymer transport system component
MAPEQARGKPIDKRVDIWAFGCVLYECLTGKRAFDGETLTDVLGAVLHTEPDLARLRKDTPPRVRELLADCLVKDPHARARDIGEVRRQLERARTEPTSYAPSGRSRRREWIAWGATAIAVLGCIFLALRRPTAPPAAPVVRTHINLPPDLRLGGEDGSLALSPDGGTLVLCASRREQPLQLWVRPLESLMLQPLSDTSGATYPFWSPDGRTIAFFADGKLKRIPAGGGSVTTVCDAADPRGGTWTTRDEIVFAPAPFGGLLRVQSAGGVPQAITKADGSVSHRVPHALPDGRRLLFSQTNSERDGILLVDLDSGAITPVSDASSDAHFVAPGELLFVRDGNLVGQPFDLSAGRLTGQPRLVVERVPFITARVSGRYSASSEGTLVYQPVAENRLEWFDLEGHSQGRIGGPGAYQFVSVSPDGRRVSAIVSRPDGGDDTWLIDGQSGLGVAQPGLANTFGMAWSPDSRSIAFSRPDDHFSTYISALDGSAKPQRAGNGGPFDWSRDGSWLSVVRQVPGTGLDVLVTRADGTGEPQVIAATAANEIGGIFSPDSRWLLFVSDPGGRDELFLAPIGRPGATRPITNIGVAGPPAWLDDGRIVFRARSGELYEMDTKARGDELEVGTPRLSFGGRKLPGVGVGGDYSITRDGRRLLAIVADVGAGEPPLILVQHGQGGGGR